MVLVWGCGGVCVNRDRHTPSTLYFFSHLTPHSLPLLSLSLVQVQALAEDTDDDAEDVAKAYRRRQHERDRAREAAARRRDRDGFLSSNSSNRGVPTSPSTDSFRLSVDSRDSGLNGNGNASPSGSLKTLSTGSVLGTQVLGDGAPPAARRSASSGRWVLMCIRPSPQTLSLI